MVTGNRNDKDKYSEVRAVSITYDTSIPIERIVIEINTYSSVYQLATEDSEATWYMAKNWTEKNPMDWHTPSRDESFLILQHIEDINCILENLENHGEGERILGEYWTSTEFIKGQYGRICTFIVERVDHTRIPCDTDYTVTCGHTTSEGIRKLRLIRRVE